MKGLFVLLLAHVSVQLQCDKTMIDTKIGSTFTIVCTYKTNQFRFNKKYWCVGDSRASCEVLMDTDGFILPNYRKRAQIVDAVSRGLIVVVRDLQLDDTGIHWVGIDKIYSDIMFRIQVTVRKENVMKPNVWPLSSLEMTCLGQPVTFRCRSERGTDVQYTWYRVGHPNNIVLDQTPDFQFHCLDSTENDQFFCSAYNDVSNQNSEWISVQNLQPENLGCMYLITSKIFSSYECIRSTTSPSTTIQDKLWSSTTASYSGSQNQTMYVNQTCLTESYFLWSGLPLWYECLRWVLCSVMITAVCVVHICTKSRSRRLRLQDKHHKDI
ncbi:polymeric immunoglobulin receptor-like [Paramisgurnus dabryanus]|uniref:polymeric immunoglobulin receptor-like n=1 Tax=Paramisgurnus dabryanus TaxID=90735 RepID=UPI0031F3F30C